MLGRKKSLYELYQSYWSKWSTVIFALISRFYTKIISQIWTSQYWLVPGLLLQTMRWSLIYRIGFLPLHRRIKGLGKCAYNFDFRCVTMSNVSFLPCLRRISKWRLSFYGPLHNANPAPEKVTKYTVSNTFNIVQRFHGLLSMSPQTSFNDCYFHSWISV